MRETERRRIFETWTRQHRGLLLKVVRAYAFTPEDQEDLFQDIALQLWDSIPRHRGESAETTWIYRVSLYAALAWTRKERKHRSGRLPLAGMEQTLRALPTNRDERLNWLYERIAELNEVDRSLILLLLEGFGYREMSEILGISESNVGVKISRIKRRFAKLAMEGTES